MSIWISRHAPTAEQLAGLADPIHDLERGLRLGAMPLNTDEDVLAFCEELQDYAFAASKGCGQAINGYGVWDTPIFSLISSGEGLDYSQQPIIIFCHAFWNGRWRMVGTLYPQEAEFYFGGPE